MEQKDPVVGLIQNPSHFPEQFSTGETNLTYHPDSKVVNFSFLAGTVQQVEQPKYLAEGYHGILPGHMHMCTE
eukprot:1146135-Pelagomonas_calceolata.AAC.1